MKQVRNSCRARIARRAGPASRILPGRAVLWTGQVVVNRQPTWLSPFFAQAGTRRIPAMASRLPRDLVEQPVLDADLSTAWQHEAECVHHAGEVDFFPARGESVRDAKAVCARCPVRQECLDFALRTKVAHGVWGGLSERERRNLRRERYRGLLSRGRRDARGY